MKKIVGFIAFLLAITPLLTVMPEKAAAHENLIPNPSVEIPAAGKNRPESWHTGYIWGDLDANFSHENTGYDGSKSVKVSISRYNTGDAKWYFDPVAIEAGQDYTFSDFYQSSVSSELIAAVTSSDGIISYQWLGSVAPSANWSQFSADFTAPANAATVSIFHIIAGLGYLQTDLFSLSKVTPPGSGIPNPDFEQVNPSNPNQPLNWGTSSWGSNQPTFTYLNSGYKSSRSVQVNMSNYQSGDAKWFYNPTAITPEKEYVFSDYYRSDVPSRVVAWFVMADGSNQYLELPTVGPSSSWIKYQQTFTAPFGAVALSMFHLLSTNGTLVVDKYQLAEVETTGFKRGIVTLTFDDGWETTYTNVLPILNQYGYHSTQFITSGFIGNHGDGYMTQSQIQALVNAGHEIGSHTVSHADLTTLSPKKLETELSRSKQTLMSLFSQPVKNFASPYGAYNNTVINRIKHYYGSHRTVNAGFNSKDNFDRWQLRVQNLTPSITIGEFNSWVNLAAVQKTWLILTYHRVNSGNVGPYDTTISQFNAQMAGLSANGIHITTMQQALDELTPQL